MNKAQSHNDSFGVFLRGVSSKSGRSPEVNRSGFSILSILSGHSNGIAIEKLHEETGLSFTRLHRSIDELVDKGYASVQVDNDMVHITERGAMTANIMKNEAF